MLPESQKGGPGGLGDCLNEYRVQDVSTGVIGGMWRHPVFPAGVGGVLLCVVGRGIKTREAARQPPQHGIIQSNMAISPRLRRRRLSF